MVKKRILYLTVRSDIGGGPIHVNELINSDELMDYDIFLACPFVGDLYEKEWKVNARIRKIQKLPHREFSMFSFIKLISFIKEYNIHLIHSHGKGAGIYSRMLKIFIPNIKVIHTFHGLGNIHGDGLINWIKYIYIEKLLKRFTTTFISVSKGEKCLALSKIKIKEKLIKVIYNGVKDSMNLKKNNWPKSIVTFSRFSHEKNMNDSYEIVKGINYDINFTWVGDGEEYDFFVSLKERDCVDNLFMIGFDRNAHQYLIPGSVYLSTSRHEGLPLALLEAEANGIPIVATNVVGNNEVVVDGYNGFLINEGDKKKAIQKIEELLNDPELYRNMSRNARKDYLKRFTVNKMSLETKKVYDEICY